MVIDNTKIIPALLVRLSESKSVHEAVIVRDCCKVICDLSTAFQNETAGRINDEFSNVVERLVKGAK